MLDSLQINLIAAAVETVLDELVADHHPALTQEHQLSSRIGQRLEDTVGQMVFLGQKVAVVTQDIPDKGAGAMEKKTGIDIYVGISVEGEDGFNKGFIVQSKWRDKAMRTGIEPQCRDMLSVSKSSYVWLYGAKGIQVINADAVTRSQVAVKRLKTRGLSDLFEKVLLCKEGDLQLGVTPGPDVRRRLTGMLERLDAQTGIQLQVSSTDAPQG